MLRLGVAAGLAALLVAVVATLDHRHKQDVSFAAQEDAWFCSHGRPSACRDFDHAAHEERWERRELGYRIGFVVLVAAGLTFGLLAFGRRHRPSS
jgi:hypothetical protein